MDCVLCKCTTDDPIVFGEKHTFDGVTAHYFCLLLSSNLVQNGDDDEGILGFMPDDIQAEAKRANALYCCYCKKRGAHIGCCKRECKKSFHFACAIKEDCQFEFSDTFRSFCHNHNGVKPPVKEHEPTELCTICSDEMGAYSAIRSIQSPCCNNSYWYHKLCLQKFAKSSGYFLKCPLCNDTDYFRREIQSKGVFIPDKDADWEETGPNSFYDFQEHSIRPDTCMVKECKSRRGRNYSEESENSRFFLLYCDCCGSSAAHQGCCKSSKFLCDICDSMEGSKINNTVDVDFDDAMSTSTNGRTSSSSEGETVRRNNRNRRRRATSSNGLRRSCNSRASSSRSNVSNTVVFDESSENETDSVYIGTTSSATVKSTRTHQMISLQSVKVMLSPLDMQKKSMLNNRTIDENDNTPRKQDEDSDVENQMKPVVNRVKKNLLFTSTSEANDSDGPIVMRKIAKTEKSKRNPLFDSDESNNNNNYSHVKPEGLIKKEVSDCDDEDEQITPVKMAKRPRELSSSASTDTKPSSSNDEMHEYKPMAASPIVKRKRKSVPNYFPQSSSDESGSEDKQPAKKKFKAAKIQHRRNDIRPSNQRTILEMFQMQRNRSF